MAVTSVAAKSALFPEELFAIILLSTHGKVSDLSQKLMELKERGADIGSVALRRAPEGFFSDDIDNYVSYLLTFDFVRERSPIKLTEKGESLCKEIAKNAYKRNPKVFEETVKILNANLEELIG